MRLFKEEDRTGDYARLHEELTAKESTHVSGMWLRQGRHLQTIGGSTLPRWFLERFNKGLENRFKKR